eukprot:TRINITY_DN1534_c3_g1_i1.p1 TRINITY_DN1534_c3_g1~~TRINITY_DN1534_c3_g1_i1.p1  ORF type:complete len:568 (+),score=153.70 TRINITY_DN1534_c3_g1_i1:88-1704(+)
MVFTILAAADVAGDKHNYEISFPGKPGLQELDSSITNTYQSVFPGASFSISRMQYYDEALQSWKDLSQAGQLKDFMQLYVFNRGAVEIQKQIPPPIKPPVATGNNYGSAKGYSQTGVAGLADNATHDEKVAAVFEELDVNNNRVIESDEFSRAFRVHGFDFSTATVSDLFMRSDANGDSVLSFSEFQRFAEMYPTLLDSLYFRIRDYWEDFRQKQAINASREAFDATKDREKRAHLAHIEAQQATNLQEKRVGAAEVSLAEAVENERAAKAKLLEIQRELESAVRERAQKAQELDLAKENERQRVLAHNESQRETDQAEQALAWQESEQAKAQDRERLASNAVTEAQREVERARRLEAEAAADLQAARDREQQANLSLVEEKRQTELAADRLQQAEMELQQKSTNERELHCKVNDALGEVELEKQRREEDERALQSAREQERMAQVAHMEAQRAIEEQEKKILDIETERQAAAQRRRQVEDQERPLLEQEVRLREQRESLEEKETRLRQEATAFHSMRGHPTPPARHTVRGPSPSRYA